MLFKKIVVAGLALTAGAAAFAQDYFDFGRIPGVPENAAIQVDLNPAILSLASAGARTANPAAADMLAGIQGVRVRVYTSLEDVDDVTSFLDRASQQLERADWQQVVRVDDDGHVRVYMKGDDQAVTGLTGMVVHEGKAVFVNIAGTIRPEQVAQLVSQFSSPQSLAALGNFGNFGAVTQ